MRVTSGGSTTCSRLPAASAAQTGRSRAGLDHAEAGLEALAEADHAVLADLAEAHGAAGTDPSIIRGFGTSALPGPSGAR